MTAPDISTPRIEMLAEWHVFVGLSATADTLRALAAERNMFKDFNSRHELKAAAEKINTDVAKVERDEARTERDAARAELDRLRASNITPLINDRDAARAEVAALREALGQACAMLGSVTHPDYDNEEREMKALWDADVASIRAALKGPPA